jgi:hypothetical protein
MKGYNNENEIFKDGRPARSIEYWCLDDAARSACAAVSGEFPTFL